MCQHIGPKDKGGLGCEEGEPVYDNDLPGPPGVPNLSCEDFCKRELANGVVMNPQCVSKVTSCADIEKARNQTCD